MTDHEKNISTVQVSNLHTAKERYTVSRRGRRGSRQPTRGEAPSPRGAGGACHQARADCGRQGEPFAPPAGRRGGPSGQGRAWVSPGLRSETVPPRRLLLGNTVPPDRRGGKWPVLLGVGSASDQAWRLAWRADRESLSLGFAPSPRGPGCWWAEGGREEAHREVRVGTRVKSRVWIRRLCRMMLLRTACVFIISQGGRGWAEATPRACLAAALWCPLGTAG